MFKLAAQPLPISKIYGQSFALYKEAFAKIWYLVVLVMLITMAMQMIAEMLLPAGKALNKLSSEQLFIVGAFSLVAFLLTTYLIGLIMHRLYVVGSKAVLTFHASLQLVLRKLVALVVVNLIIIVVMLLGTLALVVPGIVALVFLIFAIPEVLIADQDVLGAIKGSCQLVWKNWWRTFIVLLVPGILMLFSAFLQQRVIHPIGALFFALFFVIFDLLIYAFVLVQYNDLQLRSRDS